MSGSERLFRVKNGLSVASAPMECLISMLYWGLRAVSGQHRGGSRFEGLDGWWKGERRPEHWQAKLSHTF